jgi:tRNA(fMet)-specific endonuclease VapC
VKCLDTDLLMAILRGKKEAYSKITEIDEGSRGATTAINAFEIFFGANRSERSVENLQEAYKLFNRLELIPLDFMSSRRAAEISAKLTTKGETIDYRDAMIAGIAVENDLVLITRNKSHFNRIKGIKLETW